jgi:hypothetical protein
MWLKCLAFTCRNTCGCETHPLLKTINRELGGLAGSGPGCQMGGNYRLAGRPEVGPRPYAGCTAGNFAPVEGDCSQGSGP